MGIMKTVKFHKIGTVHGEAGPLPERDAIHLACELALAGHTSVSIVDVVERAESGDTRAQVATARSPHFTPEQIDEIARQLGLRIAVRPPGH